MKFGHRERRSPARGTGGTFVKHYHHFFDAEVKKACRTFKLSGEGAFRAPEVKWFDSNASVIGYERLNLETPLSQLYISCLRGSEMSQADLLPFRMVGEALVDIHHGLVRKGVVEWSMPSLFRDVLDLRGEKESNYCGLPQVTFHCDYGFTNIWYDLDACVPMIIDPSPNLTTSFHPLAFGTPYLDIGHLFSSLDGRVPLWSWLGLHWGRVPRIKEEVLAGYNSKAEIKLSMSTANSFGAAVSSSWYIRKYGNGLRARAANYVLYGFSKGLD